MIKPFKISALQELNMWWREHRQAKFDGRIYRIGCKARRDEMIESEEEYTREWQSRFIEALRRNGKIV